MNPPTPPRGSSTYYSLLFTPKPIQQQLSPLLAYCAELRNIAQQNTEANIVRTKLAWWRDETTRMLQQQATHPLSKALAPIVAELNLPQQLFADYLLAIEMDLDINTYPTWKELDLYASRLTGSAAVLMSYILGFNDPKTEICVREFGLGLHLSEVIQNLGLHLRQGHVYLPQQDLELAGLNAHGLRHLQQSEQLSQLLATVSTRARSHLENFIAQLPTADRKPQLPHLIRAKIALALLSEITASNFDVLHKQTDLTALRKLWIAMRARNLR